MTPEAALFQLFTEQHGTASVSQALALDIPRHRIDSLVRSGYLRRVSHGILAPSGMPQTWDHRAMVGVLRGGYGAPNGSTPAALFGLTAAFMHGLDPKAPEPIEVLTTRRIDPVDGYLFRRTSRLPQDEIARVNAIPSTDAIRTFIDVCDIAQYRARTIFYRGLRGGSFTIEQVLARCEIESRQGRGGLVLARSIADGTSPGAARAKSAREDEVYNWLVEAGLPAPERNFTIASSFGWDWEIDLFYQDRKHGIEVSPYWHHGDHRIYERDNLKINDLRTMGITITKVTDDTTRSQLLKVVGPLFAA
jgi:hypothetical protein